MNSWLIVNKKMYLPEALWEMILCMHGPLAFAPIVNVCVKRVAIQRIARFMRKVLVIRSRLRDGDVIHVRTVGQTEWHTATVLLPALACFWKSHGRSRYYFFSHPGLQMRQIL